MLPLLLEPTDPLAPEADALGALRRHVESCAACTQLAEEYRAIIRIGADIFSGIDTLEELDALTARRRRYQAEIQSLVKDFFSGTASYSRRSYHFPPFQLPPQMALAAADEASGAYRLREQFHRLVSTNQRLAAEIVVTNEGVELFLSTDDPLLSAATVEVELTGEGGRRWRTEMTFIAGAAEAHLDTRGAPGGTYGLSIKEVSSDGGPPVATDGA